MLKAIVVVSAIAAALSGSCDANGVSRLACDLDGSGGVDFADFILFSEAFGHSRPACDLNGDGSVSHADFAVFAGALGLPCDVEGAHLPSRASEPQQASHAIRAAGRDASRILAQVGDTLVVEVRAQATRGDLARDPSLHVVVAG